MNEKADCVAGGADTAIEAIELPLLLEAIYQRYGYDFRDYAPTSLRRRLAIIMKEEGVATLSAFQNRVLHQPETMARFLGAVPVETTAMFRNPRLYGVLRDTIVPELRQAGQLRVWHAGCSTGEEVYSMAILLHEEHLFDRARIYATDIGARTLERAKAAIFPLKHVREYTVNYQKAGGMADFSQYYTAKHDSIILRKFLRANIVWAEHNLVTDGSFNEFQIIFCRNVLIYFNRRLQDRVHRLFYDSLAMNGLLVLGSRESLSFTPLEDRYKVVNLTEKIYRKVR